MLKIPINIIWKNMLCLFLRFAGLRTACDLECTQWQRRLHATALFIGFLKRLPIRCRRNARSVTLILRSVHVQYNKGRKNV